MLELGKPGFNTCTKARLQVGCKMCFEIIPGLLQVSPSEVLLHLQTASAGLTSQASLGWKLAMSETRRRTGI